MEGGRPRNGLRIAASLGAAALLLWLFFRNVSLKEVATALANLQLAPLFEAMLLALGSYAFRAWRWGLLLQDTGRPPFATLAGCTAAGFATSTVLPARLGEIVRPLLLTARAGIPAAATLASIVAERLLDLFTVALLLTGALIFGGTTHEAVGTSLLWTLVSVALLAAGVIGLVKAREWLVGRLEARARGVWGQRLVKFARELLAGLAFWGRPLHVLHLGLASLLVWGLVIAQIAITARAFERSLGVREAILVLAVSVVGLAVPTPGAVGGFHAATQFALRTLAGWPLVTATSFAIVHHAVCFVPVSLMGFGYMLNVGFSWRKLRQGGA